MHLYAEKNGVKFVADNTPECAEKDGVDIGGGWRILGWHGKGNLARIAGAENFDVSVPQPWLDAQPDYLDSYRWIVWSYAENPIWGAPLDVRTLFPAIVQFIESMVTVEV
jgi:hypothetical protein